MLRPSNLFVTVDYDRSLIPGVIVMALFMGSLTSGVFNWVMDRFMGVTKCYLVTPLSRWNLAGGILGQQRAGDHLSRRSSCWSWGCSSPAGESPAGPGGLAMLCGVIIV